MTRSFAYVGGIGVAALAVATHLLMVYYAATFKGLFEEVLLTILSGCIFAIPSYFVQVKINSKVRRRTLKNTLESIQDAFCYLNEQCSAQETINKEGIHNKLVELRIAYNTLVSYQDESTSPEELVQKIKNIMFDLYSVNVYNYSGSSEYVKVLKPLVDEGLSVLKKISTENTIII